MQNEFFNGLQPTPAHTSVGSCELPILYRDASLLGVAYRVNPQAARDCLGDTGLEPVVYFGKATALLCIFEYRDTSIGVYNEIGLAIHARLIGSNPSAWGVLRDMRRQPEQALMVVNLPVTTEPACVAGKELWGYPKYVRRIDTDFHARGVRAALQGEFELEMGRGWGPTTAGLPFVTFSTRQGKALRTIVEVGHRVRWGGARGARLRVLGDGPTADTLRRLEMNQIGALAAFRTDAMRAILPAGQVMPWRTGASSGLQVGGQDG